MPKIVRLLSLIVLVLVFAFTTPKVEAFTLEDVPKTASTLLNNIVQIFNFNSDTPESEKVLAAHTTTNTSLPLSGKLTINIPSLFNAPFQGTVINTGDLTVTGRAVFNEDVLFNDANLDLQEGRLSSTAVTTGTIQAATLTLTSTLTAPNVLYSVSSGNGISISSGQNPTITNTGVLSLQGSTGALSFTAGSGMSVSGLTLTNSDRGSSQNIFKTISDGTNSFSAGSNTDTLTVTSGTGINIAYDTANKKLTFSSSAGAAAWSVGTGTIYQTTLTDKIGIGTSSPSKLLDVAGTGAFSGLVTLTGTPSSSAAGAGSLYINPASATADYTLFGLSVGGTEKLRIDAEGDIHIQGSIISTTPGTVGYWSRASTNTYLGNTGDLVGIGTSAPAAGLEVTKNGAASLSGGLYSGTWYTGGSSTTTKPQLLVQPTGTTSTGWSTSGTGVGVNAASSFAGNLLDLQQAGNSTFKVAGVSSGVNGFTFTTGAAGSGVNMSATGSDTNIALTVDSKGTGAINLGTGASAKTITIGNNTGATALAFTSGTGSQTFTSSVVSGTTTSSAWVFNDAALTTGTGAYFTSSTLTTGKLVDISNTSNTQTTGTMFNISSTATSLTTGSLATLDWSPGSVQTTAATGNLFNINIGSNASNFAGNLFNVADASSSIFSISKSSVTSALPLNITAPGDATFAYDIQMTNPTSSFVKSTSSLVIQAGEAPNSSNLTFKTYNQGSVVVDSAVTTGTGVDFTNNTVTTGTGLYIAANALTTGNATNIVSTSTAGGASGSSYLLNLSRSGANANTAHTAYGLYSTVTNTNATSGTNTAGYFSASGATTANYAIYSAAGNNYFNGNVGIGTTAPGKKLHIVGDSNNAQIRVDAVDNTKELNLIFVPTGTLSSSNLQWMVGRGSNVNRFEIRSWDGTTDTTRMAIDNSGNVGIGTTAPTGILHVAPSAAASGAGAGITLVGQQGAATSAGGAITLTTGAGGATSGLSGALTLASGTATSGSATGTSTLSTGNATAANSGALTLSTGTTTTSGTTGAISIASGNSAGTSGAISIDTGTGSSTGAITIGTANTRSITLGNATGATALAFTSGTGSQTFTSSVATTATTSSAWVFTGASLTSGTGAYLNANALTSGKLMDLASTSTALTTGNLISLDWSPGSVQTTAATGNLFNINIGSNASNFAGNLFNVADASSSIFSVSKTSVTTSLPVNITASGDSTFAYDINMTNPTASFVKSLSALTLQAGESFNSSDLTLKTYNQGSVVFDSAVTTGTAIDIQNTTLTTGYGLSFTGPSSTGITGSAIYAISDIGSAGKLVNLAPDFSGSAVTGYGIYNAGTDSTAAANTNYGYYGSLTLTGNAAKNGYGIYQTVTSSSTTADTIYAANLATSVTGIMTAGTRNIYGLYANPSAGAESTGGTTNVYGGYFKADADVAAGGTVNGYGLYVANGAFDTDGTSTQYGLYVAEPTGADTNYAIYSAGGVNYFSGQLQAGSGTVGAPSYSFSAAGVTDAGMYNPIGAALGFVADGGEVLRLASPTQVRLGTSTLAWGTNLGGEDVILLRDAANILAQRNGTTAQTQRLYNTYTDASNYERAELNWASNANVFTLQTTAAGTGTVRNIALMGGNVGIGTTAPSSKLDVTTAGLGVTQTTSSGLALVNTTAAAAGAQQMSPAIRWSGFGWKTDATAASQSVDFRAFVTPVQGTANPTGFLGFGSSINGGAYSDNQLVLTSGGNVGIGTTAPVAPFEVKASGTGVIAKFTSTNTTGCTLADGGTISCTSDRNFKKNIANLPYGLDTLMALNPVEFNWNSQENGSQKTLGFIAQEVETVVPNLVMTDPSNGHKQLNTIGLVPVLAKSLQQQQVQIKNNESRMTNLESRILDLESQISTSSADSDPSWSGLIAQAATTSANLSSTTTLNLQSSMFQTIDATISGTLKALGDTFLSNTIVAGTFSIDGTMSISGSSINSLAVAGDTLGVLYIQDSPLATLVDFFNGQVKITKEGEIIAQKVITEESETKIASVDELKVSSKTLGKDIINKGEVFKTIFTDKVSTDSGIFITALTKTDKTLSIENILEKKSFDVVIPSADNKDLRFNWWIVGNK